MKKLVFTAQKRAAVGLKAGVYVGQVDNVAITEFAGKNSEEGGKKLFADPLPQLEVTLRADEGVTKAWFALRGYKTYAELEAELIKAGRKADLKKFEARGKEGFAVLRANNERVECPVRTEKAMQIVGEFLGSCGYEEGTEVDFEDLQKDLPGTEIGFRVGNSKAEGDEAGEYTGSLRVVKTYPPDVARKVMEDEAAKAESLEAAENF